MTRRENSLHPISCGEAATGVPDPGAVSAWFRRVARALPWRDSPRNAYHALVAESMLQQTQVSRVEGYFSRFIGRFPRVEDLARADEGEVLALWAGLGYYRRARSLHAAARAIVAHHAGRVPESAADLIELPGVGRYTAGSISSIVFGRREPIVDGNVMRVLLRVHGRRVNPDAPATRNWAWRTAQQLVEAADDPGTFNEGLMELGALVCLPAPAAPQCDVCPWRECCRALAAGRERVIPRARQRPTPTRAFADVAIITRAEDGSIQLERRSDKGMWAGMWQAPTLEREDRGSTRSEVAGRVGLHAVALRRAGSFIHRTTHREIRFTIWSGATDAQRAATKPRWESPANLRSLAISSAQRRAIALVLKAADDRALSERFPRNMVKAEKAGLSPGRQSTPDARPARLAARSPRRAAPRKPRP